MAGADDQALGIAAGSGLRRRIDQEWRALGGAAVGIRTGLAAARVVALAEAAAGVALPEWLAPMTADLPPGADPLRRVVAALGLGLDGLAGEFDAVQAMWPLLAPTEAIMETGGDIRLQVDPHTKLNGYGASHRPRPWAITYASSTASSISERGYEAADAARRAITGEMLRGAGERPVACLLSAIRGRLSQLFGIGGEGVADAGGAVVLAASGTDTELLALAIVQLAAPAQPVLAILVAPEETGSGVPAAAVGRHFAIDTASGRAVVRESTVEGFRGDTELATVALRDGVGAIRPIAEIEADITARIAAGLAAGQRVVLHALDLSKTGQLAPRPAALHALRARFGGDFDIVVDACQLRLSPASVRHYLALDAIVLVTGSKFLTGPPFSGALLLPPGVAARLHRGSLPAGLAAYVGREEFPRCCPAAAAMPQTGNYGLALRWVAALAECDALLAVAPQQRAEIMAAFGRTVVQAADATAGVRLLDHTGHERGRHEQAWERLRSVFGFGLAAPFADRWLDPAEARAVYRWLNADLAAVLPGAPRRIAERICHIGQPVALPSFAGGHAAMGVLRIACGARLIAGEPSHAGLSAAERLKRELDDVRVVFQKVSLILGNWAALAAADPEPRYRS